MSDTLRLGVSACFFHADPQRPIFKGKTLLYAEESMLRWVMEGGALPVFLPRAHGRITVEALVAQIDGLLLQGGSDVSPLHYGEQPLKPEWAGDHARDLYEIELVRACMTAGKPVLGICRGLQLLNVACGGSLYQDLETQYAGAQVHRDWTHYDQRFHQVRIEAESWLGGVYAAQLEGRVNSVHHQAVREVGEGLEVSARSVEDGVIEALHYVKAGETGTVPFATGVQWHPEFLATEPDTLGPHSLMTAFLEEIRQHRRSIGEEA